MESNQKSYRRSSGNGDRNRYLPWRACATECPYPSSDLHARSACDRYRNHHVQRHCSLLLVFAISEILGATLRAENYVMVSTITNILGICIYRIIWVKFLVPRASVPTILYCYPISWSICSIIILIYFIYRQRRIQSAYHLPSE